MVSSIFYNGDGSTRIFPVSFKILGDDYVRVYVNDVEVVDKTKYDIINNSIVFITSETPAVGTNNVKIYVATSSSELGDLGAPLTDISSVANNLADIISVNNTVVPNLPEILLADDNATIATTQANLAIAAMNAAEASEDVATAKAGIATTQAGIAITNAGLALTYKDGAETAKNTATTQAGIATTKASEASISASNALASEVSASASATAAQDYATSINPSTLLHNTGDETKSGVLTFTSSPIAPTPAQGDSSTKLATTQWVQSNAVGAKGGGTDKVFFENDQVVTTNYTITSGKNAMSAGMITINNGVTVTVPSGSTWAVV